MTRFNDGKISNDGQRRSPENQIRESQLITPFGTGALTQINNQSVMICDSQFWQPTSNEDPIVDIRLQSSLNAAGFIAPPTDLTKEFITGVSFPQWYFGPKNRELRTLSQWRADLRNDADLKRFNVKPFHFELSKSNKRYREELIPVRLVCACRDGHIQDFPWMEWAHSKEKNDFPRGTHRLKLKDNLLSGTIGDLVVECSCTAKRNLQGVFDDSFGATLLRIGVNCHGRYGWKKNEHPKQCHRQPVALMRNANNLYFSDIVGSVNIPEEDTALQEQLVQNPTYQTLLKQVLKSTTLNEAKTILSQRYAPLLETLVDETENSLTPEKLINVFSSVWQAAHAEEKQSQMDYRRDEYLVLTGAKEYARNTNRFDMTLQPREHFGDTKLASVFQNITLLNQLEVISVLKGYSRIRPIESDMMLEQEQIERASSGRAGLADEAPVNEVSLRRSDNRFVALKNSGEGIFIELSSQHLNLWRNKLDGSKIFANIVRKRSVQVPENRKPLIDPAYYMLHTFSHILLRELSFASGYSSSALKERLYFSRGQADKSDMAGILIYTSSADSEGTLGGLVRQGIPDNFFKTLASALEKARWCSYDPTCIDSSGQGRDSLNIAACHACALVAETSCEMGNVFLDRGVLVGTLDEPNLGFFSAYINE